MSAPGKNGHEVEKDKQSKEIESLKAQLSLAQKENEKLKGGMFGLLTGRPEEEVTGFHGDVLKELSVPLGPIARPDPRGAFSSQADVDVDPEVAAAGPKKRMFRKFSYRGVDLDALLDMSSEDLVGLFPARARRRFSRGLKRKPMALVKKLCKAVIDGSLFTLVCSHPSSRSRRRDASSWP
ncbi:uncharacterized protein [Triticum aestivum]|uniref:uncharacterized protein n=1 Tax=Triticum aestivum TaxID=4565 RepID=UPI001D0100BB|nr:uncharacterized protein LOC123101321 [Triticum aestivum]